MDLSKTQIFINQRDETGVFWCEGCEDRSALDDGYGANVLLERATGRLQFRSINNRDVCLITNINAFSFKKFILSIVARDHLMRLSRGEESMLSDEEFNILRTDYGGISHITSIAGLYLPDNDFHSAIIHRPVQMRHSLGVNFQLLNFAFNVYFLKSEGERLPLKLQDSGQFILPQTTGFMLASYENFDVANQAILDNQANTRQLQSIRRNGEKNQSH